MNILKKKIYLVTMLLFFVICQKNVFGYDDQFTHPALTDKAIEFSILDQYLKSNLFFLNGLATTFPSSNPKQTVTYWLKAGSTAEDHPLCRASTHFHNPLKSWATAGASEVSQTLFCPSYASQNPGTQYSALVWGTGHELYDGPTITRNNQTMGWDNARSYFYSALTSANSTDREANFAKTFQAVGQVMHLLQDMAVPAHVRDDFWISHVWRGLPNPYEGYVRDSENTTHLIANLQQWQIDQVRPDFAAPRMTDFWDTIADATAWPYQIIAEVVSGDKSYQSKAGLAEYTNANFLSEGTLFSNSNAFTYPSEESTQIVVYNLPDSMLKRPYYYKTANWDVGYILAGVDTINFIKYGLDTNKYSKVKAMAPLDENVHKEYAERLVPRAVAYSAMLIDYFFRGTIDITWPDTGVYSIADGSQTPYTDSHGNAHQQFTKIDAWLENTTPNGEEIGAGTVTAVARYKIIPNYAPDLSNYPPDPAAMKDVGYSYSVSLPEQVNPGDIVPGYDTEFIFNFQNSPIPAGITDLTLQVVFKGTIGNETDNAIAVGMKDLMEPTHLTVWNLTDMFSVPYPGPDYSLYTYETLKTMAQPGNALMTLLDETKINGLDDEDYLKPTTENFTVFFWDGFNWTQTTTVSVPAGKYIRMIVLTDQTDENYAKVEWGDPADPDNFTIQFPAVVNQAAADGSYPAPTPVLTFREGYGADNQALVPIRQHYYVGIVGCIMGGVPATGNAECPYAEEQAQPVSLTPIPFTSVFDSMP